MRDDPVRRRLKVLLRERDLTLSAASAAIGRNRAYLQQFVERGHPKVLGFRDSELLGELLGCDPAELRHEHVPPRRRAARKAARTVLAPLPGAPLAPVPEVEVDASAGPGALADEFVEEVARWYLPEAMIRHEGHAQPEALRILRVRGDSMEPEIREGDRLVVDTNAQRPATGELFVLWDGSGLVVKRVEAMTGEESPRLRLRSANPDYPPYTCLAEETHIVGKVVWVLRRM